MSSWYTENMSELHIKLPTSVDTIIDSYLDFATRTGTKENDIIFCMSEFVFSRLMGLRLANGEYLLNMINEKWYLAGMRVYFDSSLDDIVITKNKSW